MIWSKDLHTDYGGEWISGENGASPRFDNNLVFINLNSSINSLAAFRVADGSLAWRSQNEWATHSTPVVATIQGVRQVIFATKTGLVSLNSTNGAFLWKFTYPFAAITDSIAMGAGPVVHSNIVYCTAPYSRGGVAAQVTLTDGTWAVQQLSRNYNHVSYWVTPVCFQGYVYSLVGNTSFTTAPLKCIELSTGQEMWSEPYFGQGGLILVNTNLLVLTETGELVLVRPNPSSYVELARYQAFQFSSSAHGKCWNSPAFSDGRIYARSTRGGVCLNVSVPTQPGLKLLAPQLLATNQLQLTVGTVTGTPLDSNRVSKIEVRASDTPATSPSTWIRLTNPLALTTNGLVRLTNTITPGQSRQFYRAVEQP